MSYLPAEWHKQSLIQLTWPHKDTDWACYLYILTKNQPKLLDLFIKAYNFAGMDALRIFMDKQDYDGPQAEV